MSGWMAMGVCVLSDGECGGRLDGVPILLCEGIGSLLETFLALGETLVLSDSHGCDMWVIRTSVDSRERIFYITISPCTVGLLA